MKTRLGVHPISEALKRYPPDLPTNIRLGLKFYYIGPCSASGPATQTFD